MGRLLKSLVSSVATIRKDLTELKTSKFNISTMEEVYENNQKVLEDLIAQHEDNSFRVKLLSAIIIRQDNRIQSLENEVINLKKDARRSNLIISGLDEIDDAMPQKEIEQVKTFLSSEMEITEDIEIKKAYRVGKGTNRVVTVQMANAEDKAMIFGNVSNLKGKTNAKHKLFFVSDDQLEHKHEQCRYFQHLLKENKTRDEEDRLHTQLRKGSLFANNDKVKQKVGIPTAQDVGVSRGYTDHYQGQGQAIRPTAALINIHEPLI